MILGCGGLPDYHCGLHCLEVPVSSGTRLHHSSRTFTSHFGSERGSWKGKDWCELGTRPLEGTGIFPADIQIKSPEDKEEISSDSSDSCLDIEGIALYIDLPCSPCKDSAELAPRKSHERFLTVGQKRGIASPVLPTGSHEQIKMTSQAEVSQRSEPKIPSSLGSHVLRALLETDNVQRMKRWRQVTPIDQSPGSASVVLEKSETLPSSKMSSSSVNEKGLSDHLLVRGETVGVADPYLLKDADEQFNSSQGESPCLSVEKTESKIPLNLGTHALRALLEADDVQKLKRRRLTTPADMIVVEDLKEISDKNSPDFLIKQPSGLLILKEVKCPEESFISPASARSDSAQTTIPESGDYTPEKSSSGGIKGKSDINSESSSGSPAQSQDRDTLDKYISRPPRYSGGSIDGHGPRKKEWLGQHHGGNGDIGIAQDAGFAGNVGCCYRSAIDKRPAAPHPGFVGDGATVQYCRICGEREDSTSSLICDSCEEVFHMSCVNARMKIVPRVDEWLCRPCKKKRKMSRDCENQGDSDPGGEPKDWWREDSGIGRIERELLRMSNGRRMKVRIGSKYQADVPEWTGTVDEVDLDDTLAETSNRFGQEIPLTSEEKRLEQERAEYNLANNIWPRRWLPATQLQAGIKENWVQCTLVLYDEGDICPDGRMADRDILCGKWRRAPLGLVTDDQWECSCALVWDPRHADCAVPQELSSEEIVKRMRFTRISDRQESVL